MPFSRQLQCVDHAPAHESKVAGVDGNRHARQTAHDAIECARREQLETAFASSRAADRVDDVVAFPPAFEKSADQLGWVLQVAVHEDDHVAACDVQTGGSGDLMAEVSRKIDDNDLM